MRILSLIHLLLGNENEFALHQRAFNFFCATSFIMGFLTGIVNCQVAPNPFALWLPVLMGMIMAFCWYLSRFRNQLAAASLIGFGSLIFLFTPGFWITNGGTCGGYQYFMVVLGTVVAALSPRKWRWAGCLSLFMVAAGLIIWEYLHPEIIYAYPSRLARFADVALSLGSATVLAIGVFLVYSKGYEEEQRQVEEYATRLEALAVTDHLTGLMNRAFAIQQLEALIYEAGRYGLHLAIIMIDFDLFKQINDSHGHRAGDQVLVEVAGIFRSEIRASDTACRYGGEEFLIICPNSDLDETFCLAERLRRRVEERGCSDPALHNLTLSCGIAEWQGEDADMFIDHADQAMYQAKRSGRNCIRVYGRKYQEAI